MNEELTNVGLGENESKVYIALLTVGPALASTISHEAKVKRPTTYLALENLKKQGLVSETMQGKEKQFKAEDPDRLIKLTRKMRRKVIEAEIALEKILPGLKAIRKKIIEVPKVTYYQGIEGVKAIIEEFTEYPETTYYFGSTEGFIKQMSIKSANEFSLDTREIRNKVGRPFAYIITDEGYSKIKIFQKSESAVRGVKILSELKNSESAFAIYGKKLAVLGIGSIPFGAIIESDEVVDLVKIMYMVIWNSLGKRPPLS